MRQSEWENTGAVSVISLLFLFVFHIGQDHTPHHTILSSRIPSLYIKCPPLSFRVKTAVASALLSVLVAMPGMTELVSEAAWLQITDETSQPAIITGPDTPHYSSTPASQASNTNNWPTILDKHFNDICYLSFFVSEE